MPYNPFENIVIHQVDTPEPDPFSKVEIAMILNTETDLDIQTYCLVYSGRAFPCQNKSRLLGKILILKRGLFKFLDRMSGEFTG